MLNQVKADCIKQLAEVQDSGQENGTAISGAPGEELEKEQSMTTVGMNTPRGEYVVSGADRDGDGIPDALQVCDLSGWCTNWFVTVCLSDVREREMGGGAQDFRRCSPFHGSFRIDGVVQAHHTAGAPGSSVESFA